MEITDSRTSSDATDPLVGTLSEVHPCIDAMDPKQAARIKSQHKRYQRLSSVKTQQSACDGKPRVDKNYKTKDYETNGGSTDGYRTTPPLMAGYGDSGNSNTLM